eukprot:6192084-Pleurochrysis_carterae.AAC.1
MRQRRSGTHYNLNTTLRSVCRRSLPGWRNICRADAFTRANCFRGIYNDVFTLFSLLYERGRINVTTRGVARRDGRQHGGKRRGRPDSSTFQRV